MTTTMSAFLKLAHAAVSCFMPAFETYRIQKNRNRSWWRLCCWHGYGHSSCVFKMHIFFMNNTHLEIFGVGREEDRPGPFGRPWSVHVPTQRRVAWAAAALASGPRCGHGPRAVCLEDGTSWEDPGGGSAALGSGLSPSQMGEGQGPSQLLRTGCVLLSVCGEHAVPPARKK